MQAARFVICDAKRVERTSFFDWGCILFFTVNKHLVNCKFSRMVSVGAFGHMQHNMWARDTGLDAEV